jgi:hypothetical protein
MSIRGATIIQRASSGVAIELRDQPDRHAKRCYCLFSEGVLRDERL